MSLSAYIVRRLLYSIPILIGVSLIIFLLFNVVAGDPTITLLGKHATLKQMQELRHELGLDRSLFHQYLDVLTSAFTFDFGRSWATRQEISSMIVSGAQVSLTLTIPAFLGTAILAIGLSLFLSFYRGKWQDKSFVLLIVGMMSIPSLAYILFGQWLLAYKWGMFEISGYEEGFPYYLPYILLPCLIWILINVGPDLRFYRTVILDELYQDYVRTARSKGLSEKVILFKHVLKNAMIPIITNLVIQIPFLILGALLLESFFSIPGLGGITLHAINNNDFPVIKAMTILTSIGYIIFSVITDVLYTVVDPRVRLS